MSKQTLPTVSRYHPFAMFIKIPPTVPLSAGSSWNAEDRPLSRSRWGCWKRRTAFMCWRWISLGRWAEVTYEDTRLTSRTPRGEVSVVKVCVCDRSREFGVRWTALFGPRQGFQTANERFNLPVDEYNWKLLTRTFCFQCNWSGEIN